jgi:hypothetical protein
VLEMRLLKLYGFGPGKYTADRRIFRDSRVGHDLHAWAT